MHISFTDRQEPLPIAGVHLAVLWSFAFAQPLLDLLGDSPEFFVARGNSSADILVLAVALVLLPPIGLTALEGLAGLLSARLRQLLHLAFVGMLTAAFILQLIKDAGMPAGVLVVIAVAIGVLAAVAYASTRAGPALLTVLGPAPLVFLFVFLVVSPVSKLVLPGEEAQAAGVSVPHKPPVVVILFDEFAGFTLNGADGRIDASRYPNFARLARNATWYRNATTVADFTDRAVPALLTGERAEPDTVPTAADHPESLFALLGDSYSLDVTEPVTDVCPERLCPEETSEREPADQRLRSLASDLSVVSLHLLLPDSLRKRLPAVDRSFGGFAANNTGQGGALSGRRLAGFAALINRMKIFRAFERRLGRTAGPGKLVFFHIQMPHNPYFYLPDGQRFPETVEGLPGLASVGKAPGGSWSEDPQLTRQALERYLLQVADTDRLLGRMIDRMQASGLYDRALVVVAADHGAAFLPGHPHRAVDAANLSSIAGIPLLIKSPGQRKGRIDDSNVNITDVLPTIADRLGVKLPWPTDGKPARRTSHGGSIGVRPHDDSEEVTLPFAEYVRRRDELVARMVDDFGSGPDDLYRGGPDDDLIGRRVSQMDIERLPEAGFELDSAGLLANVNPTAPIVPSLISGELSGAPDGSRIAVAVDGRVAGTAVRWRDGDAERFAAIVPPTAFARGANAVDLVVVTGAGSGRRLARLPGAALDYRLVERGGREAIVDGSGHELPVGSSTAEGSVDEVQVGEAEVRIQGWAADGGRNRPADRVLAFAGPRFLAAGRPSLARAGFKLSGWTAGPRPDSPAAPVRVFALVGGQALELRRLAKAP